MGEYSEAFVAFDVAKMKHAVAVAEGGRTGEVRFLGEIENRPGGDRADDQEARQAV
jgi:transposase